MMKIFLFSAMLIILLQTAKAQKTAVNEYAAIDKKALQLPDTSAKTTTDIARYISANFTTDKNKARAIFIWVASNIQYDIENMFAINFYEKKEDKISKPLITHKGICENYAAVFNDVCLKCGIRSYVIEGYTKQNGFTDYIPHAWCAALIDTSWMIFDPTWGSGYISNGSFIRKINNSYCMANPAAIIRSHMPFDYLWQFLYYPVSNQEFYEGKTAQNKAKPFFNYKDSIQIYENIDSSRKLLLSAYRIEKNGVKNSLIFDRLQHIKIDIENAKINAENNRKNKTVNLYNSAGADYNEAVNNLNTFIDYRNHQFLPEKTDADIQAVLDSVDTKLKASSEKLNLIENADANTALLISQLLKASHELKSHLAEQQDWLNIYFSKSKAKRKAMFFNKKISWFGIPLN